MNKERIKQIIALCIVMLIFLTVFIFCFVSEIQYIILKNGMIECTATVTDIDIDLGHGGYKQIVGISYMVDGVEYTRQLGTDTTISVSAGVYGNMKEGDTVKIFYNPDDPYEIASEKTSNVGLIMIIFSVLGFLFFLNRTIKLIKSAKTELL